MDLFTQQRQAAFNRVQPLAVRMRPRNLDEFLGQQHFVGPGKLLRRLLAADRLSSAILYGPPGTGKTTLAHIIAAHTHAAFEELNAAGAGVKDVRDVLARAKERLSLGGQRTVLFLDEIHRFNRAQQDVLLSDVENGLVILIGATTENPFFSINSPLVSRSQIFQFEPLNLDDIKTLLRLATTDPERGLGQYHIEITDEALGHLAVTSDGDARRALLALEVAVLSQLDTADKHPPPPPLGKGGRGSPPSSPATPPSTAAAASPSPPSDLAPGAGPPPLSKGGPGGGTKGQVAPIRIDLAVAEESIQRKAIVYDGTGDEHYDAASALIKSMRGSDPDAAVYWLARMLEAGEDPRFIARRVAICAAEDVGNADPMALVLANAAAQVTLLVGMPECQLPLSQAVTYVATAPKSNAAAMAIWAAGEDVRAGRTVPVPRHLRDKHYPGAERLGHGEGYKYAHSYEGGYVQQDYLGVDKTYYQPTDRGHEARIAAYLQGIRGCRRPDSDTHETPRGGEDRDAAV